MEYKPGVFKLFLLERKLKVLSELVKSVGSCKNGLRTRSGGEKSRGRRRSRLRNRFSKDKSVESRKKRSKIR